MYSYLFLPAEDKTVYLYEFILNFLLFINFFNFKYLSRVIQVFYSLPSINFNYTWVKKKIIIYFSKHNSIKKKGKFLNYLSYLWKIGFCTRK